MNKKISKIILTGLFLSLIFGFFSFISIKTANADGLKFNPNVTIPDSGFEHTDKEDGGVQLSKSTKPIADYMKALYNWGVGIVGVLAGVVLIIAGIMWLTAGGNNTQVESAKKWISGALSGLVLALGSYFLLFQINPELVKFKYYTIDGVNVGEKSAFSTCYWKNSIDINENSKEEQKDASYCPDTKEDHSGLFCVCQKKDEVATEVHKACCKKYNMTATGGYWDVGCQNVGGPGPDQCNGTSGCTLSSSLPECSN